MVTHHVAYQEVLPASETIQYTGTGIGSQIISHEEMVLPLEAQYAAQQRIQVPAATAVVEPAYAIETAYIAEPAYALETAYIAEPAYALETAYIAEPAYALETAYIAEPAYALETAYIAEPAYAFETAYVAEPAYALETAYIAEPAYVAETFIAEPTIRTGLSPFIASGPEVLIVP